MTPEQRKIVNRALRIETIIAISMSTEARIEAINQSDSELRNFFLEIWERTQRTLRREGNAEIVEQEVLGKFDFANAIRSMIGNTTQALDDMKELAPPVADRKKTEFWDTLWRAEKVKSKRHKYGDVSTLPKKILRQQDAAAEVGGRQDVSGAGASMRTAYNSMVAHILGLPHEALDLGQRIGSGAFGECRRVHIKGVSFLPEHITYCAKCYKGGEEKKQNNFQTEQSMQVLHPSIVRCIAFTTQSPWVNIFPFYNGPSLGDMMCKLPFVRGEFRRTIHRLHEGWSNAPLPDRPLTEVQHAEVRAVIHNMPHIMHAIVEGLNAAHMAGILHTDLHPFNIMLDFTRDTHVRVGIIDWGLLLRVGQQRHSQTFVYDAENHAALVAERIIEGEREKLKRPWLAPEIFDPRNSNAYTRESDIYALGYLLSHLHEFWKHGHKVWMNELLAAPPDEEIMNRILRIVKEQIYVLLPEMRKPLPEILEFFRSLRTNPIIAQRPLVELSPAFYLS